MMKKITNNEIAKMLDMDIQVFYRLKRKYPLMISMVRKFIEIRAIVEWVI